MKFLLLALLALSVLVTGCDDPYYDPDTDTNKGNAARCMEQYQGDPDAVQRCIDSTP